jgi:hypothetical protein
MVVINATAAGAQQYPPTPQGPAAPVAQPPAAPRGGGLAFTGTDVMPLVWVAIAAVVAGTLMLLAVRRRALAKRRHRLAD